MMPIKCINSTIKQFNIRNYSTMANVFIQIDKPFYIAGDTVNGCVFLNLYQNVNANEILIKFKGWESVKWFEERIVSQQERAGIAPHLIYQNKFRLRMESSDSEDHPGEDESAKFKYVMDGILLKQVIRYTGQRQIARFDQVLYNFGGNFIPAGQYSFPFSFKTGQNYPASFIDKSVQNNRRGRIKYQMQAFARGFNDRLILLRTKQEIIIREMAPIKNDQQQMEAHVKSCCCIDQGITRIQCFFQKNGYIPGQDARIYCKLDNTLGKSEVVSVDVTLVNQITYTSSQGFKKTFTNSIFKRSFSGLGPGQQGERENVVKVISTVAGTGPEEIKPTSRGNRLHSVYFLVVEANLAAACTCCSDLPIVRQPILIYPYIPIDYHFKAPPNWNPKIMPAINLQVGLSALGIKPQVNMSMGMPNVNANISMNMGAPNVNMNVGTSNVNMNMSPPKMNVNVNGPSANMQMNGPNFNMNVGVPSVNMHVNGPQMHVNGPSMYMNAPNMQMHVNSPSIHSNNQMGLSVKVPSPHVEMSVKTPPTTMHMHGNLGGGVHIGLNENFGNGVGLSANINSSTKHGGVGVGMNLRPF